MNCGLVVPLYNEEERFSETYFRALLQNPSVSILFVDDGSTDKTLETVNNFCKLNNRTQVISFSVNRGKAEAVRVGMLHLSEKISFTFIGFLDADGAVGAADISVGLNLISMLPPPPEILQFTWF